jgi:hypothetical protein
MTKYLLTQHKSGKIGVTAHLTYDGVTPLCKSKPCIAGKFIISDPLEVPRYVCGDCYRIEESWKDSSSRENYKASQKLLEKLKGSA